jgi:IMP dehydrogenase
MLHKHRIEKLLVVDEQYRCVGLHRQGHGKGGGASAGLRDAQGRLRVAAATTAGEDG